MRRGAARGGRKRTADELGESFDANFDFEGN